MPESSIDWIQKIHATKVDLDHVWKTEDSLKDNEVGNTPPERTYDLLVDRPKRENDPTPFNIAPVHTTNVSDSKIRSFIYTRRHMFVTKLWHLVEESYLKNNESFQEISATSISQQVREVIQTVLRDHPTSQKIYIRILSGDALGDVTYSLSDAIAKTIAVSLSDNEKQVTLEEARLARSEGKLLLPEDEMTEEILIEDYIGLFVDDFLDINKARVMLRKGLQGQ